MCAGTMCGGIFGVLAPAGSIGPMALISKIMTMMMIMMMNMKMMMMMMIKTLSEMDEAPWCCDWNVL